MPCTSAVRRLGVDRDHAVEPGDVETRRRGRAARGRNRLDVFFASRTGAPVGIAAYDARSRSTAAACSSQPPGSSREQLTPHPISGCKSGHDVPNPDPVVPPATARQTSTAVSRICSLKRPSGLTSARELAKSGLELIGPLAEEVRCGARQGEHAGDDVVGTAQNDAPGNLDPGRVGEAGGTRRPRPRAARAPLRWTRRRAGNPARHDDLGRRKRLTRSPISRRGGRGLRSAAGHRRRLGGSWRARARSAPSSARTSCSRRPPAPGPSSGRTAPGSPHGRDRGPEGGPPPAGSPSLTLLIPTASACQRRLGRASGVRIQPGRLLEPRERSSRSSDARSAADIESGDRRTVQGELGHEASTSSWPGRASVPAR